MTKFYIDLFFSFKEFKMFAMACIDKQREMDHKKKQEKLMREKLGQGMVQKAFGINTSIRFNSRIFLYL